MKLVFHFILQLQNILLETSVVGYIDFDLLHNGTRTANNNEHWLQITGNQIFSEVVKSVVKEVGEIKLKKTIQSDMF